jgi:uncharacterized protein YbjT (DUF2867 family)
VTLRILVTGGTGTLGTRVVARLLDSGCQPRVLSRRPRSGRGDVEYVTGDLQKNEGIAAAVAGAAVIVHCAGRGRGDDETTGNLVRAAARAGSPHLVYISVVGADRVPVASAVDRAMFGYFASKLGAERAVEGSGLPWTTLRATQFHESLLMVARQMAKLPVLPVAAGFRFQPVSADEVAARLAELAMGTPAGLVPDMAGPRTYPMGELLRVYLRAHGKRRALLPVPIPGRAARAVRDGAVLAPGRAVGKVSWEDFVGGRAAAGPATTGSR